MKLRESNIEKLKERTFDILIIGGGINGAVSASALTSQGASVALIDKHDFAGFTSQESSNLVWGGIKYLESYEFGLVRKLCLSRNHLLRHYPSTVQEIRFFVTLDQKFRHSRWFLYAGTWLYWFMGNFFTKIPHLLSRASINKSEPIINTEGTQGGFCYSDAYLIDNDARFVFNFVRESMDHGGIAANYIEALGSTWDEKTQLWMTRVREGMTGEEFTITSKALLNTCGPFADKYNALSGIETSHHHLFSKGIHLLIDRITESDRVLTFFADDGRLFFMIPMGQKTCIGTTDTRVDTLPPRVTDEDRDFVLRNINKRLKLDKPLTRDDILAERCGVRPLVVEPNSGKKDDGDWTSLSRKHIVEKDEQKRHITIFGGKLTDCLNVGNEICETVQDFGIELPHFGFKWFGESPEMRREFFHRAHLMGLDELTPEICPEPLSQRLWRRYAIRALFLLEEIRRDPKMAEVMLEGTHYMRVEIEHIARHEMVTCLDDFMRRRSKVALVNPPDLIEHNKGLMEACKVFFGEQAQAKYDEYFEGAHLRHTGRVSS
ncbi:MAG: FAD-dependent oxidoreductase [Deltaproteobacteria bacterium]|nr:FAD-dependent oxidoreductase [Deltaproteobacteria bacterium]|tara:strand:- start:22042 stop:23685 length:1644 start_codon:yes stop_codon:yes gene_type:complete